MYEKEMQSGEWQWNGVRKLLILCYLLLVKIVYVCKDE